MYRLMGAGLAVFLSVPGCAWMRPAPSGAAPSASQAVPPSPAAPKSEADASIDGGSDHNSPAQKPSQAAAPPPSVDAASAESAASAASSAKPRPSSASRPVKQSAAAAAAPKSPAAPASKPAPTLDLASLEQRLRDTRAIGVFTKLSLKNQVDDLLNEFRVLYQGPNKQPTAELRKRYDELLLKVLDLLKDGDPPLAAAIASSREAIWSILADPEKFAKI